VLRSPIGTSPTDHRARYWIASYERDDALLLAGLRRLAKLVINIRHDIVRGLGSPTRNLERIPDVL